MTFDAKDKALISTSSLVGYCRSAGCLGEITPEALENWFKGLLLYAEKTASLIDETHNQPGGE